MNMEKVIEFTDEVKTVELFNQMKVGVIYRTPFAENRFNGIKSEASRRNKEARIAGKLKSQMDLMYRISTIHPRGYISIIKLK